MGATRKSPRQAAILDPQALIDCIHRVGRIMENVEEPEPLLRSILEECKSLMRCEAASIALVEPDGKNLRFSIAAGGNEAGIRDWLIPLGKGIVGLVAQTGDPLISNDPENDPRWLRDVGKESDFVTRNLAAVPFHRSSGLSGVVEVINREGNAPFDEADLRLLQFFADQAAVAIEIQRLIDAKSENERLAGFAVGLARSSHSVKNILHRMKIPQKLIDEGCAEERWDKVREPWRVLRTATVEINDLVLDMLDFSKPCIPDLQPADVAALVNNVYETCAPDARDKRIDLRVVGIDDAIPGAFEWLLDIKMISGALMDLVGNAIEAIADHKCAPCAITVAVRIENDWLRLSVADAGPGIPADVVPKLFTPFATFGKKLGTGLGLANVKRWIEAHGGSVKLETAPGQGAAFTLLLPRDPPHPEETTQSDG
jgi:signal transduction histidine kinase